MKTADLILRCYARKRKDSSWYAVCIDLNLDAEADSFEAVKQSLNRAVDGYLETIVEVNDPASLVHLLRRPAPVKERLFYHTIRLLHLVRRFVAFEQAVPVHPASHCHA